MGAVNKISFGGIPVISRNTTIPSRPPITYNDNEKKKKRLRLTRLSSFSAFLSAQAYRERPSRCERVAESPRPAPPRLPEIGEMLDGILGRGFSARCKSLIQLTTTRIDVIRRKRNATEKFLKKDIADLLANGLDINAYGRAEGLLIELTLSSCYLYIELCCQFMLKQLSLMQKVSDCPENCRETVSSLIYAAARFSDLPELRELREVLQERYGNSLDHFVNQEFAERMEDKPSTMENKVKLMQDIALEFSISWDAKAFDQRMSRPPSILQDQPKHYGSSRCANINTEMLDNKFMPEKKKTPKVSQNQRFVEADDQNFQSSKERRSFRRHKGILDHHPKTELSGNRHDVLNEEGASIFRKIENGNAKQKEFPVLAFDGSRREDYPFEADISGTSHNGKRHDGKIGRSKRRTSREKYHSERDSKGNSSPYEEGIVSDPAGIFFKNESDFTTPCHAFEPKAAQMVERVRGEEAERPHNRNGFPPPYVRPNSKPLKEREYEGVGNLISSRSDANGHHKIQSSDLGVDKLEAVSDHRIDREKDVQPSKAKILGSDEEPRCQYDATGHFLPGPKSVRRKHLKSRPIFDDSCHEVAEVGNRTLRSIRRREEAKKGLQVLFDDEREQNDEEERTIDRLLMHYSKKPSTYEPGRLRRKGQSHRGPAQETDLSKFNLEVQLPPRSISLPNEQTTAAETPAKTFTRAASLQTDGSSGARHVHPKLPEYDDLAARLASLRGS